MVAETFDCNLGEPGTKGAKEKNEHRFTTRHFSDVVRIFDWWEKMVLIVQNFYQFSTAVDGLENPPLESDGFYVTHDNDATAFLILFYGGNCQSQRVGCIFFSVST